MIRLELVLQKLGFSDVEIINPTNQSYVTVVRNEHAADLHNEQIINIMTSEEFAGRKNHKISGALLIVGDICPDCYTKANHDLVIIKNPVSLNDLVLNIQEILQEYRRFLDYKIRLEDLAASETSLQDFFSLFSSYFHNPVVFGDSGGNILYMGNIREDFHDYDESINYWITHGYVPYEFSKDNGNIEMTSVWQKSPVPVLLNKKFAQKYPRLSYRTCRRHQVYNNYFSIVQVHEKYNYFDKEVLVLTGDQVSAYYEKHGFMEIESPQSKFLRQLVCLEAPPDDSLKERARHLYLLDSKVKSIVVLDFSKDIQNDIPAQARSTEKRNHVRSLLSRMQPPVLYFEEDNQIVLLLKASSCESLAKAEQKLRDTLQAHIVMACSCSYENIFESCQMYKKAGLALDTGKTLFPDSNIYFFNELFFETLLYILYISKWLPCFILPGLEDLIDYDRHKNTDFAYTLYQYLLCDKNIATLSKKLHIHRNTTLYRLEKANEWLNIDLTDSLSTVRLFISFKALEFFETIKKRQ